MALAAAILDDVIGSSSEDGLPIQVRGESLVKSSSPAKAAKTIAYGGPQSPQSLAASIDPLVGMEFSQEVSDHSPTTPGGATTVPASRRYPDAQKPSAPPVNWPWAAVAIPAPLQAPDNVPTSGERSLPKELTGVWLRQEGGAGVLRAVQGPVTLLAGTTPGTVVMPSGDDMEQPELAFGVRFQEGPGISTVKQAADRTVPSLAAPAHSGQEQPVAAVAQPTAAVMQPRVPVAMSMPAVATPVSLQGEEPVPGGEPQAVVEPVATQVPRPPSSEPGEPRLAPASAPKAEMPASNVEADVKAPQRPVEPAAASVRFQPPAGTAEPPLASAAAAPRAEISRSDLPVAGSVRGVEAPSPSPGNQASADSQSGDSRSDNRPHSDAQPGWLPSVGKRGAPDGEPSAPASMPQQSGQMTGQDLNHLAAAPRAVETDLRAQPQATERPLTPSPAPAAEKVSQPDAWFNDGRKLNQLSIRITDDSSRSAEVRVIDRAGEIKVAVRSSDSDLTSSLRGGLPDLVASLDRRNVTADVWHPAAGSPAGVEAESHVTAESRNASHFGHQQGQQQNPDSQGGQGSRRQQDQIPEWMDDFQATVRKSINRRTA